MSVSGFVGKMLGSGVIEGAKGIANIVDQFMETDDEKRAAAIVNRKLQQRPDELQVEINKVEAGHRSLFVAGARPFILWVCGTGFLFSFIINPILQWLTGDPGPDIPVNIMMDLTLAMLGLASLRTYEKLKGLTK
jgi:hypothetical protein